MSMTIDKPPQLGKEVFDFIVSFYSTSDNPEALQAYIAAFTEDATIKFGNAEFPASAIPTLRKGMWDQVVKRRHTVSKIYQSHEGKDYMIQGHVDLDFENGHAAHGIDFAARMQFVESDNLKMKHYQVFFDATPGKAAKTLPHQSSSMKSTFVNLPTKQLHVRVTGSGPAVILLHGLGSNGTYWNGVVEASSILKSSTCYLVDFDGHGASPLSGPLTIESLSQDVIDLMDALKLDKAALVGHSMSGLVVSRVAAEHPNRVSRLVCVGGVQQLPEAGVSNMRQRCSNTRSNGLEPVSEAVANGALSEATKKNKPEVFKQVKALVRSTKPLSYIAACDALIEAKDPDYTKIHASTLLIGGSEDALAPPPALESLASKISKCRVEVLQDVGHWQAVEAPRRVATLIDEFGK